jgi:hypothetical protein
MGIIVQPVAIRSATQNVIVTGWTDGSDKVDFVLPLNSLVQVVCLRGLKGNCSNNQSIDIDAIESPNNADTNLTFQDRLIVEVLLIQLSLPLQLFGRRCALSEYVTNRTNLIAISGHNDTSQYNTNIANSSIYTVTLTS